MVAIDTLKFDNEMNAFIINANIVLYYVFFLSIFISIISLKSIVL